MPDKLKKFFEFASYDSIVEEIINIVETSLDGLSLLKIDDPNEPWGPCGLVEMDYDDKYVYKNNLKGIYAIDPPRRHTIKISIRFNNDVLSNQCVDLSDIRESIEELEDRLKGEGYDWERYPFSHEQYNLYRYTIYLGKWSHYKDEWGASINRFISEKKENLTFINNRMDGKDFNFFDFFLDLSDEFGLTYYPIPNELAAIPKSYWENSSSNGGYYISRNANKINILIVFKKSYIEENIREFIHYMEELEDRIREFTWIDICDNRFAGAKNAYEVTNKIIEIDSDADLSDKEISFFEKNKKQIPTVYRINCVVGSDSKIIA